MLENQESVNELNRDGMSSLTTVARLYDSHRATVGRWYKKGIFPKPVKIGTELKFKNSDLLEYNESLKYVSN